MAILAGRPPYATDDDNDSFYEAPAPPRRLRKTPQEDPNKRTTAYDVYDNYLSVDANESSRHSGINGVGAGLLAMEEDDDEFDSSESESTSKSESSSPPASKNAALAAATAVTLPSILRAGTQQPMNIAAPRPGYAAPIAALNNVSSPEPAAVPTSRRPSNSNKAQNPFIRPSIEDPFNPRSPPAARAQYTAAPPPPPIPPSPHPLQPPITPITPVFARPAKPTGISFAEKPAVTRTERTVLPSRGEKGDDFWKRFSMVAKEPSASKESNWLKETRSGYSSLSRWVWCIGMILLICGAGAIGIWLYVAHKNANRVVTPTAVGGSADEAATYTATSTAIAVGSDPHVSPTNTVARRDFGGPEPTGVYNIGSTHRRHANRMMDVLF